MPRCRAQTARNHRELGRLCEALPVVGSVDRLEGPDIVTELYVTETPIPPRVTHAIALAGVAVREATPKGPGAVVVVE
jgi:hypothetical protein